MGRRLRQRNLPGRSTTADACCDGNIEKITSNNNDLKAPVTAAAAAPPPWRPTDLIVFVLSPWQAVADAATSRRAPILVTGNNVEVTEPLKDYVEKKMANVLDKVCTMM